MKFVASSVVLFLCISLSACVTTKNVPLSRAGAAALRGHSLSTTRRSVPSFSAATPVKVELGMVGALAMVAEGNSRIRENQVNDPANCIAAELAKAVAVNYGAKIANTVSSARLVSDEGVSAISKAHQDVDYVVDVRTINWSSCYYPINWFSYRVIYSAKFRLINTRTHSVLCEGFYSRVPNDPATAPSYSGLMENNAARLKSELNIAAEGAIHHFKADTLKL
jgi:hypothetical protein